MSGLCVIGLQWGDEAKGKLVDILTADHDIVVRYQGGANAGHTVVHGDETYKLHHIPSGILNSNVENVITPGVVLNPPTILEEIDSLLGRGVTLDNLMISDRVHVVMPWHLAEDRLINDTVTGDANIGTTLRGIGPCYQDKVGRAHAIRLGDFYRDNFRDRVREVAETKQRMLRAYQGDGSDLSLDGDAIYDEFHAYGQRLAPYVRDTTHYLLDAIDEKKTLLFEGAQGALLDIDHGTYPFVTSSNSSGVGICPGSGVPPKWVGEVVGVAKCYSTRVGGGPFPTELDDEVGQHIRDMGNEYGTTTGRPRRCGWFDAVAVRYTARLSGVDRLALMMLDVLSELPEIQVCVAYELNGKRIEHFPGHAEDLRHAKPILETVPGWQQDITGVREFEDLPENAQAYVHQVEKMVGVRVRYVSVGPDRAQTIFRD